MEKSFLDLRVLIFDEVGASAIFMQETLKNLKIMRRSVASSYKRATEMVKEKDFDFILADWVLENDHGINLVDHLRQHEIPQIQEIPIIIYTSVLEQNRIIRMSNSGVHEIIAKPLKVGELKAKIASAVRGDRPFVRSPGYTGPERRFKKRPS
jgi:DNA-binding response OmpR family regulator